MTKRQKAQRIIGVMLIVALLIPIVVMSIPTTYTEIVFSVDPATGTTKPEFIDHTYIPLVALLRTVDGTFDDISFLAVYVGLFVLGIWLVVYNMKHKLKEA